MQEVLPKRAKLRAMNLLAGTRIYDRTAADKITAGLLSAGDHRAGNRLCGRLSLYR